ncbi:MAG TPA: DNA repair protein RadA [Acidimicrobiales bacterium]|nr:DNA repair protein RadA [Acidimicrobiales bacterium]
MPKLRTVHRCTDCGSAFPQWAGRCGACGEWNSLVEDVGEASPAAAGAHDHTGWTTRSGDHAVPIAEVDTGSCANRLTGIDELDRVLGGGLVAGSVTLLGGEPGIGKSTLLLQALASLAARGERCLLVSAEESKQQVRLRASRLGALPANLWLLSETAMPNLLAAVDEVRPDVLVLDSIQSVFEPEVGSSPGSVAQVRECAQRLVGVAKERALATVLVGHVTKDGALAGPRVLEHVVDTVLSFEGERHHSLRLLRAVKHRFGPTGELGLFEMGEDGLAGVPDAAGLFLGDRREGVPGSVVVPAMEGQRPLLVELQALVAPSNLPMPRRSAQGLESGRLALLLAVLHRRAHVSTEKSDVYASAVGGVRVTEPAADLALGLALASAVADRPVPADVVACGEVGLAGEVRQVAQMGRRLAEAARLGFRRAVVPASGAGFGAGQAAGAVARTATTAALQGMEVVPVATLGDAIRHFGLHPPK